MNMKKILIAILPLLAVGFTSCKKDKVDVWRDDSPIIDFKDTRLLKALMEISDRYDGDRTYTAFKDMNGDGKVSEKEAARVQYLDLSGYNIRDFSEIAFFSSLEILYCYNNDLRDLDISKNTRLKELNCMGNKLTSLDISKNTTLTSLNCKLNGLTSLDVNGCSSLKKLSCENNDLSRLILSQMRRTRRAELQHEQHFHTGCFRMYGTEKPGLQLQPAHRTRSEQQQIPRDRHMQ